jgi:uncharacterized membrane protein
MMGISSIFWTQVHGAATHFPIAFLFGAALFDAIGFFLADPSKQRSFQVTGYWLLILSGLSSFGAVFSGLAASRWRVWGTGSLLQHHLFAWPAFALIVGLTSWRVVVVSTPSRRAFALYLSVLAVTCALVGAAGWSGGELLTGH